MRDRVEYDAATERPWTFLTAHAQVLVCIDRDPLVRLKDIAAAVGITERAVQTVVGELVAGGYVNRRRVGKRNVYGIDRRKPLRHALVKGLDIGSLLANISEPRALGDTQAELELTRERFRTLVERLPVVVYRCSVLTGGWHYISPAIESLVGLTAEEWHAHPAPWGTLVHPDDRADAVYEEEQALAYGRPLSSEYRLRRPDGTDVWVRDVAFLVEEDGEPQWHGVFSDVTERRELEARLRQSQKLEVVGQLAGGIAHDFNNLLVAMSGYAELALERVGDSNDELREEIDQIAVAASKARDLTSRLLAFSRKESSSSRSLDLNEAVASAEPMLRRLIGPNVELIAPPALASCIVEVDASRLDQALLNLAINARDAMPGGGTLTITTGAEAGVAFLRVADTGTGVPEHVRPHLFEPFFTTKAVGLGTGLGLSTIREFAEESGGSVDVESTPGAGAAFTLRLPVAGAVRADTADSPAGHRRTGSETVLLVEDNEVVRDVTELMLGRAGYEVVSARDGAEALELADGRSFDLLLSDIVMPGLSGPETAALMRGRSPETAVLFMSGYAPETEGSLDGAELLRKPFHPTELLAAVRRALDDQRSAPAAVRIAAISS